METITCINQDCPSKSILCPQKRNKSNTKYWVCTVCGYIYNDEEMPFETLPDDWNCPLCGISKKEFKFHQD